MTIIEDIYSAVLRGKRKEVAPLVQQALDEGLGAEEVLNEGLVAAMSEIGERFSRNEAFVPEMLVAARAMSAGTEVLKPHLAEEGAEPVGKAVIGTVKGDMHDIGKNLVRMMIEGKGFEVTDLGVDVAPEQFVTFLQEHDDVDVVCCSALLTTTMPEIGATIRAIEEAGLRDKVKVMVGGAPVTQAFADEVGADAYTPDAGAAAARAVELVRG
ncbi:MAG: cobalamin-binding protein [Eggerthellaceae bacterium]|nr:cobalamin-binding protein [Eggerthellaceae bacterium]